MARIFLFSTLAIVPFAVSCEEPEYSVPIDQSDGIPVSGAEAVGVAPDDLASLAKTLDQRRYRDIDSVLLLKQGRLIFESYSNGYSSDDPHDFASVTKSITSLLCGIAIDRGFLSGVDAHVHEFYAGTPYAESWDESKQAITIENLLTMQHGLDCDDYDDPDMQRFNRWLRAEDPIAEVLALPVTERPGTRSSYCTASTQLLRLPLETATGLEVEAFAANRLFGPLGIEDMEWARTPSGQPAMGYGGRLRPRDVTKIGLMVAGGGLWHGERVVSDSWIEQSFQPRGTLLGIDYGYLWYGEDYHLEGRTIRSHLAMGHGGQFLILFPRLEAILVIASSDYDSRINFYNLIQEHILPLLPA